MIACQRHGFRRLVQKNLDRPDCLLFNERPIFSLKHRSVVRCMHHGKVSNRDVSNPEANHVIVLGGGITGLATAFFLTQDVPKAKITILEKSSRLGGWLESPIHEIGGSGGGHVVFENGPRTLRQDDLAGHFTRDLIDKLGLVDDLVVTPRNAPASRNRFLYYPDHLVRMPAPIPGIGLIPNIWQNLRNIQREPVFDGLLKGVASEVLGRPCEKAEDEDESVGHFLSRRFPRSVADNLVSAILHGIYAGDLYRLSARSLLPLFHFKESKATRELGYNSLLYLQMRLQILRMTMFARGPFELALSTWDEKKVDFAHHLRGNIPELGSASVFTFRRGLQQLADALETKLKSHPKVTIKLNASIDRIEHAPGSKAIVTSGTGHPDKPFKVQADYMVSTLSAPTMSQLLPAGTGAAFKDYNYAVNVMVVNLFYRSPTLIPVQGFGYLIPRSVPFEENPESALGVIFGSDSSIGQDTAEGTKLTVMMGGHWWDGLPASSLPDSESAIQMAKNVLSRHLGITAEPLIASAKLQESAIPQYTVGHTKRLKRIRDGLVEGPFRGRIKVAGSWYTGVGVNDCITASRHAALTISEGNDILSGLEDLIQPRWVIQQGGKPLSPSEQEQLLGFSFPC